MWYARAEQYPQPWAHPLYGLSDCSNGTSGEALREITVRAEMRLKPQNQVIGYTLALMRNDAGEPTGAAMFFKDLTRVERLEEEGITAVGILTGAIGEPIVRDFLGDDIPGWLGFLIAFGTGFAGEGHTIALRECGVTVEAICSRTPSAVQAMAAKHGIPTASTDWRHTLDQIEPDLVAIATPGGDPFSMLLMAAPLQFLRQRDERQRERRPLPRAKPGAALGMAG